MKRIVIPALFAFGAVTLLGLQPASSGMGVEGTITATPATIEAGESVDIVLEGNCFDDPEPFGNPAEHGGATHVIATIKDPNGATVFTQAFTPAPSIDFTFSDTPTLGTYTVTADCDFVQNPLTDPAAGTADIQGSYTPGEFTVVEADAEPADVVAATPTFTG